MSTTRLSRDKPLGQIRDAQHLSVTCGDGSAYTGSLSTSVQTPTSRIDPACSSATRASLIPSSSNALHTEGISTLTSRNPISTPSHTLSLSASTASFSSDTNSNGTVASVSCCAEVAGSTDSLLPLPTLTATASNFSPVPFDGSLPAPQEGNFPVKAILGIIFAILASINFLGWVFLRCRRRRRNLKRELNIKVKHAKAERNFGDLVKDFVRRRGQDGASPLLEPYPQPERLQGDIETDGVTLHDGSANASEGGCGVIPCDQSTTSRLVRSSSRATKEREARIRQTILPSVMGRRRSTQTQVTTTAPPLPHLEGSRLASDPGETQMEPTLQTQVTCGTKSHQGTSIVGTAGQTVSDDDEAPMSQSRGQTEPDDPTSDLQHASMRVRSMLMYPGAYSTTLNDERPPNASFANASRPFSGSSLFSMVDAPPAYEPQGAHVATATRGSSTTDAENVGS